MPIMKLSKWLLGVNMQSQQCISCKHRQGGSLCKAFGNKPIPTEIITGLFDHSKPYPNDNGYRYEMLDSYAELIKKKPSD